MNKNTNTNTNEYIDEYVDEYHKIFNAEKHNSYNHRRFRIDDTEMYFDKIIFENYEEFREYLFNDEALHDVLRNLYYQDLEYKSFEFLLNREVDIDMLIADNVDEEYFKLFDIENEEEIGIFNFKRFLDYTKDMTYDERESLMSDLIDQCFGVYSFEVSDPFHVNEFLKKEHKIYHLDTSNLHTGVVKATIDEFNEEFGMNVTLMQYVSDDLV